MSNCEVPTENHSRDRVALYYGKPEPMILCGYHASQVDPGFYERMEVIG